MTDRANWIQRIDLNLLIMGIVGGASILFSLLVHWEPGHETLGYWVFARIFVETGDFIIPDRSPLYTIYLAGFRWMGYPTSVTVEYLVSTTILAVGLVALFRPYLRTSLAIFAVILWIPFFQLAEPPVQKMALAAVAWAVVARRAHGGNYGSAASYALLGMAYMLRSPFAIFLVLFVAWDTFSLLKSKGAGPLNLLQKIRPRLSHWPVYLLVVVMVIFLARQSPNQWNNVYFGSTTFFPNDGKSFSMVQNWNWGYILDEYQTFIGHDFYDTNEELFGGASNTLGMIRSNPRFIVKQTAEWSKSFINIAARMTDVPRIWSWLPLANHYLAPAFLVAVVFGAIAAARKRFDTPMTLIVIGGVLLVGSTVATRPESRYMVPMIPVLILSASWYGGRAKYYLTALEQSTTRWLPLAGLAIIAGLSVYYALHVTVKLTNFGPSTGGLLHPSPATILDPKWVIALFYVVVGYLFASTLILRASPKFLTISNWLSGKVVLLALPLLLLLFSNGLVYAQILGQDIVSDVRHGDLRIMESRRVPSLKNSISTIEPLIANCNGVLALEHTYFGSFTNLPLDRFYDVMKIPPFGSLGSTDYDGLRPDRVDCVLVSETFATMVGAATNVKLRYDNYVIPYVRQLQEMGATTFSVSNFGDAIIFTNSGSGTSALRLSTVICSVNTRLRAKFQQGSSIRSKKGA